MLSEKSQASICNASPINTTEPSNRKPPIQPIYKGGLDTQRTRQKRCLNSAIDLVPRTLALLKTYFRLLRLFFISLRLCLPISFSFFIHAPLTYKAPTPGSTIPPKPTVLRFLFFRDFLRGIPSHHSNLFCPKPVSIQTDGLRPFR